VRRRSRPIEANSRKVKKTTPNSNRRETRDLRQARVSHLRRLISPLGTGHWLISASNMSFLLQPWHILVAALCGMVNERQQQIIEFQNAQIEALLKKLGKKRLLLDDDQRRLLAVKAHAIGRKALLELTTIVTPDTILRWHRKLVAKKFDSSNKRQPGAHAYDRKSWMRLFALLKRIPHGATIAFRELSGTSATTSLIPPWPMC
jgi:hypothetical protein